MRFLHTSDWHLGRLFNQESLHTDQEHVLEQILSYAIEYQIEAILLSGDIYDRNTPPAQAISLFDSFLRRLNQAGIRMIMISGNHDSAIRVGFAAHALEQGGISIRTDLHSFPVPVVLERKRGRPIHIYGLPYIDPEYVNHFYKTDPPIQSYQTAHDYPLSLLNRDKQAVNILLAHCFIEGASISESERQLSVGAATAVAADTFKDFDYVALGHMHGEQFKSYPHIRYSGSILKYSFSEENHQKSVTLIDIDEEGGVTWQHLPLHPLNEVRTIEGYFQDIIQAAPSDPNQQDYIRVILHDSMALLEPMTRLREFYPNILKLERLIFKVKAKNVNEVTSLSLKRTELDIFNDFYRGFMGQAMSQEQQAIVHDVVQALRQQDQER